MPAQQQQQQAMYPTQAMAFEEQLAMEQMMAAKASYNAMPPLPMRALEPVFEGNPGAGAMYPVGHPAHFAHHAPTYGVPVNDPRVPVNDPRVNVNDPRVPVNDPRVVNDPRAVYARARAYEESDAASVGSSSEGMGMGRARSGSNASGSGYGSPGSSYDAPAMHHQHHPMMPVREEMVHQHQHHPMMRHAQMQQVQATMGGGGSMHGAAAYAMMM